MTSPPLLFERLSPAHDRAGFSCEHEALTEYLHRYAGQNERGDLAATFVAVDAENGTNILGYYTISAHAVLRDELSDEQTKGIPKHDRVPAYLIGRLARDLSVKGLRVGELLLLNAFGRLAAADASGRMVVVDPIDERARQFYERYGFTPLGRATNRLFLPMSVVRKAVS